MKRPTVGDVLVECRGNPIALAGVGFYMWILQRKRLELLALLEERRCDLEGPRGVVPDAIFPPRPPGLERFRKGPPGFVDPVLASEPAHAKRRD